MSAETYTVDVAIGSTPARVGTLTVEGFLGRTWRIETTMTHDELNAVLDASLPRMSTIPVVAKTAVAIISGPADLTVSDKNLDGMAAVTLNGAGPLAIVSTTHHQ